MALKRHSYLVQWIRLVSVLLNHFLDKTGDVVIQFNTTCLQNVLLHMPLTAPWFTDTHPQVSASLSVPWYSVLYSFIEWSVFQIEELAPSQQLRWTVLDCPGIGWSLWDWQPVLVRNWNWYLKEFVTATVLQFFVIAEIVNRVGKFFIITGSISNSVKLIHF